MEYLKGNNVTSPQRYVITYRKTKLAVIESTALLCFIGRYFNQCSLGLPQISKNVLLP